MYGDLMKTAAQSYATATSGQDRVIEHAIAAFVENGYEATTIDDIAKSMQATKGFIYHYFTSKAEILYRVYSQAMDDLLDMLAKEFAKGEKPEIRLERALSAHISFILRYPVLIRTTWAVRRPDYPSRYRRKILSQSDRVLRLYSDGVIAATHPPVVDLERVHRMVHHLMASVMWLPSWIEHKQNTEVIAQELAKMVLASVQSR